MISFSKKIICVCICLLSFNSSLGQNFLQGKITDLYSGKPLREVNVFINYNYVSASDAEGNYLIKNIAAGNYVIKISSIGYKTISDSITITSGRNEKHFKLSPAPIELDEIVVRTGRIENYLRNSAYSEILVGKAEIEEKPFQSLPDVLKTEPGVSLLRDGVWGTDVNIRGLSRENVITLIDGNRIATSTDIAARLSMIGMEDVERVEIIKGASSSIYGSGATGGIVNIITKSPEFSSKYFINGNISGGYNSVNNSSVTSASVRTGESLWSSRISGAYRKAGNIQTPEGVLNNSQFEDYSLSGALNIRPFEDHTLKLNYQLFKAEDVGIPGSSVFPSTARVRYPDEKRELISGQYEILNISEFLYKFSAKYAYQSIERNVENIPGIVQNLTGKRVSVLKITPNARHRNNNIELLANMLLSQDNTLAAGVDYWDRSYHGNREKFQLIEMLNSAGQVTSTINKITGEKPLPDSKSRDIGIFLQDEAVLLKNKLSLSIGARADKIFISGEETRYPLYEIINGVQNPSLKDSIIWPKTETTNSSYGSNLGLRYSLNSNLDVTLSLGLSFRSPSLEERFQFIDQGSYVRLGNPGLKSELGKSSDLGIRLYLHDLKIISSVFYNSFTDLVVEMPGVFENKPAYIKANIGKAKLYGFDLSAEYNFYRDFVFYSTLSYVRGDDVTSGSPLPGIPPLNSTTGLKVKLFDLQADISSNIFARQNNPAAGEQATPGYAVFNISITSMPFEVSFLNFRIYAGAENIFDKSYRNHLATTRGDLTLEPGRNFYLKLVTGL